MRKWMHELSEAMFAGSFETTPPLSVGVSVGGRGWETIKYREPVNRKSAIE